MTQTQTIHLGTSEPRGGHWCPDCALPSAVEVDIHEMCPEHGSHPIFTVVYCSQCTEWDVTEEDE